MRLFYIDDVRIPTEKAHGYQIMKMCEAFAKQGLDVHLVVPGRRNHIKDDAFFFYNIEKKFKIHYLPIVESPSGNRISFFIRNISFLWSLRKFARFSIFNNDVIFTRNIRVAWLLTNHPCLVLEIHNIGRFLNFHLKFINPKLFITINSYLKKIMVGYNVPSDQIIIAHDAVDLDKFKNLPSQIEIRRKLGLPENQKIIGYIGRLHTMGREKGVKNLILAAQEIVKSDNILFLFVGGPQNLIDKYGLMINELKLPKKNFLFVNQVPFKDVPLWLSACDTLVMPWPNEIHYAYYMSPLKMFEYMAAKKPIISSDLPSIREVLDNSNAVLVEPDNLSALVNGIKQLLNDTGFSQKLAIKACNDVLEHTWLNRSNLILSYLKD